MSNAYYAVKKGRKPGVYDTWTDCKRHVHKFKGAEYKKFNTLERAQDYLGYPAVVKEAFIPVFVDDGHIDDFEFNNEETVAYVDGSFNEQKQIGGYGLVLVKNNDVILKDLGGFRQPELLKSRNVFGEMQGAIRAVELALANGFTKITIVHDYEGIRHFARGEWKAKTDSTQDYQQFMERYLRKVDVSFVKVKSHSGNTYNNLADKLAKRAVELK